MLASGGCERRGEYRSSALVVEDDLDNRDVIARMLELGGYRVAIASDGRQALCKAEELRPALILMHMAMPEMDGWTATRWLKQQPHLARIPAIAITAHTLSGDDRRALAAGCQAYSARPIDYYVLMETIALYISR